MRIARITISDRACAGIYEDRSGPVIDRILSDAFPPGVDFVSLLLPDEAALISAKLRELADVDQCNLIVTTGGTGISPRDVTPEATRAVLERELPGFGEAMRMCSLSRVPTAVLSRAIAGTRGQSLILNLPGKPSAARECLDILLPAIREGITLLRGEDPHIT